MCKFKLKISNHWKAFVVLFISWLSITHTFAFQNGDYVLISYKSSNSNTTHYVTAGSNGSDATTPTVNSIWQVSQIGTPDNRNYQFTNVSTGTMLGLSRSGRSSYTYSVNSAATDYTTWTVANAGDNSSTMTQAQKSNSTTSNNSTYYLRYNNSAWGLSTSTSQTLTFTVLSKNKTEVYSAPTISVQGSGVSAGIYSLDFNCNTEQQSFDLSFKVTKSTSYAYVGTNINIPSSETNSNESVEITSLEQLKANDINLTISTNADSKKDTNLKISASENTTTNKLTVTASDPNHFAAADKQYTVTVTVKANKTLGGNEITQNKTWTQDLIFNRLAYTKNTEPITDASFIFSPSSITFADYHRGETKNVYFSGSLEALPAGSVVMRNGEMHLECSDVDPITLTANHTQVAVMEGDKVCSWCSATFDNGSIKVSTTADNVYENTRSADLRLVVTYTLGGTEYKEVANVPITQPGTLPTSNNKFYHNVGFTNQQKGLGLDDHGQQRTHTYESTIYMIPGSKVQLVVKEKDFHGWQRWFDYDTGYDVEATGTTYSTKPKYDSSNFTLLPIGVESTSTNSRGRYRCNMTNNGNIQSNINTPIINTPASYAGREHTIACDMSSYVADYRRVGDDIYEPTLSYRNLFHLLPAQQMADKMEATVGTTNAVESYKIIMPTTKTNLLPTTWKYQKNNADSTLNCYIYKVGNAYKRVGITGVSAEWYVLNGTNYNSAASYGSAQSTGFLLNAHTNANPNKDDTITFVLRTETAVDGKYYNLVKYEVIFRDIAKVGPVAEPKNGKAIIGMDDIYSNYNVLALVDFNFNKPNTTSETQYSMPLDWDEASFGFSYPSGLSVDLKKIAHEAYGTYGPAWGEYGFYNTTKKQTWLYWLKNHGTGSSPEKDGYFMYCDGTQLPGKVCSLKTDAYLCQGEKIYCSAFISNANSEGKGRDAKPLFKFVIEGRENNSTEWHEVSQYMSGHVDEANSGGTDKYKNPLWQQINFEVELDKQYEEFRISVWNFAAVNSGNDFAIDDICIYSKEPPLMTLQTENACSTTDSGKKQILFRADYQDAGYASSTMYYRVVDQKTGDAMNMGTGKYKSVEFPAAGANIKDNYTTYSSMAAMISAVQEQNPEPDYAEGFIEETLPGGKRYVMYLLNNFVLPGGDYQMQVTTTTKDGVPDFTNAQCATTSDFSVADYIDIDVTNSMGLTDNSDALCPNGKYSLSADMTTYEVINNELVERKGYSYCDWVVSSSPKANWESAIGYTEEQIKEALADLRAEALDNGNTNPNLTVQDVTKIDHNYLPNETIYNLIVDLVERKILYLYERNIDIYMPAGSANQYVMGVPIFGTGRYIDAEGNDAGPLTVCSQPIYAELSVLNHEGEAVMLGTAKGDDLPAYRKNEIPIQRCSLTEANSTEGKIGMPIQTLTNLAFCDEFPIIASSDPDFNPKTSWFAYEPLIKYNKNGSNNNYYKEGNTLQMKPSTKGCPTGKTAYTLKEGYIYTIEIPMQTLLGQTSTTITDEQKHVEVNCPVGAAYINLYIVPSYVKWNPGKAYDNNWSNDNNWQIVNEDGTTTGIAAGQRGFVPLGHTSVIIDNVGDNSSYPVINNLTLQQVIDKFKSTNDDDFKTLDLDNYYDYGFQPCACKNILFRQNSMMLNQDLLTYEKAFVDMVVPTGEWTVVSSPLKGVVSGDMYIPNDADASSKPFVIENYNGARQPDNFAFWMSLYNSESEYYTYKGQYSITNAAWGALSNSMTEEFAPGRGVAILGFPPIGQDEDFPELNVRLPKQETVYNFYTNNGQISTKYDPVTIIRPENYGKLAYEIDEEGDMSITLTNQTASNLFLFGNPTMAYIDMNKFLKENELSTTFYYFNNNAWNVENAQDPLEYEFISREALDNPKYFLPPMRAVLIKTASEGGATELTVSLNNSMLAVQGWDKKANEPDAPQPSSVAARVRNIEPAYLNVYATNEFGSSHLIIGESPSASDEYVYGEDADLVTTNLDGEYDYNAQDLPITPTNVYTVIDKKAVSVDVCNQFKTIPLLFTVDPVYKTDSIRLLIDGVFNFAEPIYFVDDLTKEETLVLNGIMIDIQTPADGEVRYYLKRMLNNGNNDTTDISSIQQVSNDESQVRFLTHQRGKVTVVADNSINQVMAYDVTGRLLYANSNVNNLICTIDLPQGAALVNVITNNGSTTGKVLVK